MKVGAGAWTTADTSNLADGTYTLRGVVTDLAGNVSGAFAGKILCHAADSTPLLPGGRPRFLPARAARPNETKIG